MASKNTAFGDTDAYSSLKKGTRVTALAEVSSQKRACPSRIFDGKPRYLVRWKESTMVSYYQESPDDELATIDVAWVKASDLRPCK